jgi:hypothetical protein
VSPEALRLQETGCTSGSPQAETGRFFAQGRFSEQLSQNYQRLHQWNPIRRVLRRRQAVENSSCSFLTAFWTPRIPFLGILTWFGTTGRVGGEFFNRLMSSRKLLLTLSDELPTRLLVIILSLKEVRQELALYTSVARNLGNPHCPGPLGESGHAHNSKVEGPESFYTAQRWLQKQALMPPISRRATRCSWS